MEMKGGGLGHVLKWTFLPSTIILIKTQCQVWTIITSTEEENGRDYLA